MQHYGIKDSKKKIIMLWSARAACTIGMQMMFNHMNINKGYEKGNANSIHNFRKNIFYKKYGIPSKDELNSFFVFKIVINPFQRIVSAYKFYANHNKNNSFYDFLIKLEKYFFSGEKQNLSKNDLLHIKLQYFKNSEKFINTYIKMENGQKEIDNKINNIINSSFSIENLKSNHHTKRINYYKFIGKTPFKNIINFPKSYKYFYDDEIKKLVYKIYRKDIECYNYSFEDLS